ncbi:hypothetical protein [Aurantiacibacter spongiae]|uniref:Envelope stress response membrane protein PspB n=1 Tax=Aurantiacibacter spongiae TaxID=2488860 RepID=A0A3N5CUV2_9SPHN|nr:hypothetical protein [Aurantiacibacter spongiae]RPF72116.1 hypothetical protein EG799_11165 [Aurantiacibacter spongiae]
MSFWPAIVLIVLIASIFGYLKERNKFSGPGDNRLAQENEALLEERRRDREEIDELRDRVAVLERIATDPARRTADEIEKLRDDSQSERNR